MYKQIRKEESTCSTWISFKKKLEWKKQTRQSRWKGLRLSSWDTLSQDDSIGWWFGWMSLRVKMSLCCYKKQRRLLNQTLVKKKSLKEVECNDPLFWFYSFADATCIPSRYFPFFFSNLNKSSSSVSFSLWITAWRLRPIVLWLSPVHLSSQSFDFKTWGANS